MSSSPAAGFDILSTVRLVADAVAVSARGDLEIVVHDLTKPTQSIVQIVNGHVSGRKVRDPLASNPTEEIKFRAALGKKGGPFEVRRITKRTAWISADRPIQSTSVMFFDGEGNACAMLCLNLDEGVSSRLRAEFDLIFSRIAGAPEPEIEARDIHMGVMVEDIVEDAIRNSAIPVERMSKPEKISAVLNMHERGVFLMRGSVEYVAKRLNVTKHSIYNYLDELGVKR